MNNNNNDDEVIPCIYKIWTSAIGKVGVLSGSSIDLCQRTRAIFKMVEMDIDVDDAKLQREEARINGGYRLFWTVTNEDGNDVAAMRVLVTPLPERSGRTVVIEHLATLPTARRFGIATSLLADVEQLALENKWSIQVVVQEDSIGFWLLCGYEQISSEIEKSLLNVYNDTYLLGKKLLE